MPAGSAQRKLGRSASQGCQGRNKWISPAPAMLPWHTPLVQSTLPSSCGVLPLLSAFYSFLCPERFLPFLRLSSNVLHFAKSPPGPTPGGGWRIELLSLLWFRIFTALFSVGSVLYDFFYWLSVYNFYQTVNQVLPVHPQPLVSASHLVGMQELLFIWSHFLNCSQTKSR